MEEFGSPEVEVFEDRAGQDMGIICDSDTQIALVPACWICSICRRVFTESGLNPPLPGTILVAL